MSGDLTKYAPGDEVPVEIITDVNDAIPDRGDGVEVVGENNGVMQVEVLANANGFVGTLVDRPADLTDDELAALTDNDSAGYATILVRHYVDWLPENDAGLSPGDAVVYEAGGVVAYDGNGTSPTHNAEDIIGHVALTHSGEAGTDGKVAVIRSNK